MEFVVKSPEFESNSATDSLGDFTNPVNLNFHTCKMKIIRSTLDDDCEDEMR